MTAPAARGAPGFTLVELLVGLSLLGLISLLLFGGLRFGLRTWEAGGTRPKGRAGEVVAAFRVVGHRDAEPHSVRFASLEAHPVPFKGDPRAGGLDWRVQAAVGRPAERPGVGVDRLPVAGQVAAQVSSELPGAERDLRHERRRRREAMDRAPVEELARHPSREPSSPSRLRVFRAKSSASESAMSLTLRWPMPDPAACAGNKNGFHVPKTPCSIPSPSNKFLIVFQCTRSHAMGLELELCGASMTLSIFNSGLFNGNGSCSKTSKAAPARRLACNASISALSSTSGPRAVLSSTALGFIRDKASPSIR